MAAWVLMTYTIPREPTSARVSVWRRLQRLGARRTHNSAWILPATPYTREQFQWLASEVGELGGEAMIWLADAFPPRSDAALVGAFTGSTDEGYRRLLSRLQRRGADRAAIAREYQRIRATDYFHSEFGERVRAALADAPARRPAARGVRTR